MQVSLSKSGISFIMNFGSSGSKPFIVEAGELISSGSKPFIVEAGELISSGSKPFIVEAGELIRHLGSSESKS